MIRRIRRQRILIILIVIYLLLTFLILYSEVDLSRQSKRSNKEKTKMSYQFRYAISGAIRDRIMDKKQLPPLVINAGNVLLRCEGPLGEDVINTNPIDIVFVQNEDIVENEYGNSESFPGEIPECYIGDAWEKDTYIRDRIKYIKVFQIECRVKGYFTPNGFDGQDKRCIVLGDTLSQEDFNKMVFDTGALIIIYNSNISDGTAKINQWSESVLEPGSVKRLPDTVWLFGDEETFRVYMGIQKGFFYIIGFLSIINGLFLSVIFAQIRKKEYVIKRMVGYKKRRLLVDIMAELLVYEFGSFSAVLFATFLWELRKGSIYMWVDNIKSGLFSYFVAIISLSLIFSIITVMIIYRTNLAYALKDEE